MKDYLEYSNYYDPTELGKTKNGRNRRNAVYESFLKKMKEVEIPCEIVGRTHLVLVGDRFYVRPVEMIIKFKGCKESHQYKFKSDLFALVRLNSKIVNEQITTIDTFKSPSINESNEFILKFGKYVGKNIKDVTDLGYIKWLLFSAELSYDDKDFIIDELKSRGINL